MVLPFRNPNCCGENKIPSFSCNDIRCQPCRIQGRAEGFSKLLLTKHAGSSLATATWNLAQTNLSCWEAYIIYNAKTWQKWMALNAFSLWKLIVTSQVAKFSLKSELQDGLFLSCLPPQYASLGLLVRDFAGETLRCATEMSDYTVASLLEDFFPISCWNSFKSSNLLLLSVLIDQENNVGKHEVPSNLWTFLSSWRTELVQNAAVCTKMETPSFQNCQSDTFSEF